MLRSLLDSFKNVTDGDKDLLRLTQQRSNTKDAMFDNAAKDAALGTEHSNQFVNSHDSLANSMTVNVRESKAQCSSEDSGIRLGPPSEVQIMLKRHGLTLKDLFQHAPPFAVEWKSVRDVSQCLNCATPIDFLSRKVNNPQ